MSSKLSNKPQHIKLIGVLVLVIGVLLGIILIKQEQDFRNKAQAAADQVLICHKNNAVWQEMHVDYQELKTHLNHGDILGSCVLLTPTVKPVKN